MDTLQLMAYIGWFDFLSLVSYNTKRICVVMPLLFNHIMYSPDPLTNASMDLYFSVWISIAVLLVFYAAQVTRNNV